MNFLYDGSNLLGALGLGMVAGGSAGCSMGAMALEMTHLMRNTTFIQTLLTVQLHLDIYGVFEYTQNVIYVGLLGITLSSVCGVIGGLQAYDLTQRPSQGNALGKALTLAAPLVALGVAVIGASVGTVFPLIYSLFKWVCNLAQFPVFMLGIYLASSLNNSHFLAFILLFGLFFLQFIGFEFYLYTQSVIFADMTSIAPLISLSFLFGTSDEHYGLRFPRICVKVPAIVITTVLLSRSLVRDEHQLVPLLDPAKATKSALLVLERFYIIVLGVQMFQASCWSVLYSYFVTDGEGKVCAGAVAAAGALLAVLSKASPMLGAEASLGCLLTVSGTVGVALSAAGDLGQRYGGHVGRAGAVVGAGVGAFLTLATQDEKFALMVALCAAAFPGSPFIVLFGLDFVEGDSDSRPWCWYLRCFLGVVFAGFLVYMHYPLIRVVQTIGYAFHLFGGP